MDGRRSKSIGQGASGGKVKRGKARRRALTGQAAADAQAMARCTEFQRFPVKPSLFGTAAGVMLALCLLPSAAGAQAMGKAAIDAGAAGETIKVSLPPLETAAAPAPSKTEPIAANLGSASKPVEPARAIAPIPTETKPLEAKPVEARPMETELVKPAAGLPETTAATKPAASRPASAIESAAIRPASGEAAPGAGKPLTTAQSGWGGLAQVAAALAVVIGLILIAKALVRKFVPGAKATSGKGVIEILARHPLAKNQSIVLVRIGSQIVALNQGRESSESVLVISDQTEVARIIGQIEGKNPNSITTGFNKLLANARMDLEEGADEEPGRSLEGESLDEQLEEMAAAKRQLMELRQHVRTVRDTLPRE